ncbi:MAG: DUF2605 domain-containing protein [Cyanobacteria bacterium J06641_5]
MMTSSASEGELLKAVLGPLLEDFQYWFSRSRELLESKALPTLTPAEQADLLARIKSAQQEVTTVHGLFRATDGKVGLEMATLAPWHKLVAECWRASEFGKYS